MELIHLPEEPYKRRIIGIELYQFALLRFTDNVVAKERAKEYIRTNFLNAGDVFREQHTEDTNDSGRILHNEP
mgnify:CR=1 FL=1